MLRSLMLWAMWGCGQQGTTPVVAMDVSAAPVAVTTVEMGVLDETWLLEGQVRAMQQATLAALASGELRSFEPREGAFVEQGDLIAEVDAALIKARMERVKAEAAAARAEAKEARAERDRLRSLGGGGAVAAQANAAAARAAVADGQAAALRARVEELSVELVRHEIRAPFRGVVAYRFQDVGDYVYTGDPVAELVNLGEVEVVLDGPSELVGDVEPGQTATLVGRDVLLGEIVGMVPVRRGDLGTVRVRIKPNEPRDWLIAGAEVGVQLPLTRTSEAVVIPLASVIRGQDSDVVVRVADDRAVRVAVRQVAHNETSALVLSDDLRTGDQILVRGHQFLRPGQLLSIESEE